MADASEKLLIVDIGGALFRGVAYGYPTEIWNVKDQKWQRYEGRVAAKMGWGTVVTEAEAEEYKRA